jgi:thymidylate synthase (FAD)
VSDIEFSSELVVDLIDTMGTDLTVARAAWVSTKGERAQDEADSEKVGGLIKYLMAHKHGSVFEHVTMQFLVRAPIFVFREWHRHRIASYNEMSGRYAKLPSKFYVPDADRALVNTGTSARPKFAPGTKEQHDDVVASLEANAKWAYGEYESLLAAGIGNEVARMVLPVSIYSAMYVTANARSIMNFLSLRTHREDAQFVSYPMREIEMCAEKVEDHFAQAFPLVHAAFAKNGRVAP